MHESPSGPTPGFTLLEQDRDGDQHTFTIAVADDCPHCDDHFPGRPIVPAIAQLDLLFRLASGFDSRRAPVAIYALQLRGVMRPGDRLSVLLTGGPADARLGFRILRGDALLTDGTLSWVGEADP